MTAIGTHPWSPALHASTSTGRAGRWAPAAGCWIALVGPLARASALPASRPLQVAVVGFGAFLAVWLTRPTWWPVRLTVAAAAAAVLYPSQGTTIAVWLAGGLVLAAWVAQDRPPLPLLRPAGPGAVAPVVVLCAAAAWQGTNETATWQPVVPFALACALPLMSRVGDGALHRATARIGDIAAHVVSTVTFHLLGLVVVVVPWALQRSLRVDPLDPRAGWAARERRPLQPLRPWAGDPVRSEGPFARKLRKPLAALAAAALVCGVAWQIDRRLTQEGTGGASSEALLRESGGGQDTSADSAWYPDYAADMAWVLSEKVAFRPLEVYRLWDVETRYVNIHDGRRDTWTPPPCECTRLTVWLYGGDGVFGFEQRDDHTIASELARVAAEDGITLDVHNRGIPAQLHWRAALRFAWDLTTDPAPDLVLFYGGAEEIDGAEALNELGAGDAHAPYEPFVEDLYDQMQAKVDAPELSTPPDAELLGRGSAPRMDPAEVGRLAVRRYDRSRQMSADTALGADLPIFNFWQPSRYTRTDREPGSALDDRAVDTRRATTFEAASDALTDDVIDLSHALDAPTQSLYATTTHHNELGARLIAEAMYRSLRTELQGLRADAEANGS